MARDFSATREAAGRSLVWQALLALLAIVLLWGAVLIVVRGLVLAPAAMLAERFGDLVRGERERAVEDPARLPEELRRLAEQHEALRKDGIPTKSEPE